MIMALASTLLVMPFRFLMPIFVVDIYHLGPESMGLLVSVMGGGSLFGSIYIAAHGNRNRGKLLLIGGFLSGVSLLLISAVPIYYFAALMMLPLGLGDAGRRTISMALIMESTDEEFRGRVMSIFMLNFGLMPLGVLPAGIASDIFGGQVTIGALAVGMILFIGCVWVLRPEVRGSQ
jgi:MFS family permease